MRLHELRVTAFGPFADTVEVDFDRLSDAGLFLLTGPTGAGKSSILDTVCFALYADVPGDRSSAKRLRSDQAAPEVAPRVELELTIGGRRFRIHRSPAWDRPKKRGSGTTRQQASVVVTELRGAEWISLATRLDEAGQLLGGLLGMSLPQFTQVALLPQGRFMAFLRADSEARHQLLQQLFRTGRFEGVERWLRDQRIVLRRESRSRHDEVADLASRVSEVADLALPDGWDLHDLTPAADDGSLRWWSEGVHARAERSRRQAHAGSVMAAAAVQTTQDRLEDARRLVTQLDRREHALAEQAALRADEPEHVLRQGLLERSRRAEPVAPVGRLAREAARAAEQARGAVADAATAAGLAADREVASRAQDVAAADILLARELAPAARRLHTLREGLPGISARLHHSAVERHALIEELARFPDRLAEVRVALDAARAQSAALPAARERLVHLEAAAVTLVQRTSLEHQLAAATSEWNTARASTLALHEQWLDLRETRLDGMAAEIAAALVVGGSCPVCGSQDHPAKAVAGPASVDAGAEKRARSILDTAHVDELARDLKVRDLTALLAAAHGRLGDVEVKTLALDRAAAVELVSRLQQAETRHEVSTAQLRSLEDGQAHARERLDTLTEVLAELTASLRSATDEAERLDQTVTDGLAVSGAADPASLLDAATAGSTPAPGSPGRSTSPTTPPRPPWLHPPPQRGPPAARGSSPSTTLSLP